MLAFSNDYYGIIFRATQSVELLCAYDDPTDIVYLYRLAKESPLLYAKLALIENGLQDYADAISEFN